MVCRTDCEHFDMPIPEFPAADELRADIDSYETMWSMYDEFNSGLNDLAKEDWISFRTRYYTFEEFLVHWYEKLKEGTTTSMTVFLQKEIEKFKVA